MALKKDYFAIVDANTNRAKEGLRVIEDISRFILSKKKFTSSIKKLRHAVSGYVTMLSPEYARLLASRDSAGDVGRKINTKSEFKRTGFRALLISNFKRVEESLRVLEEVSKISSKKAASGFKELRYETYVLEKKLLLTYKNEK
jgi:thiamine-phosphate pyrophosphorylase